MIAKSVSVLNASSVVNATVITSSVVAYSVFTLLSEETLAVATEGLTKSNVNCDPAGPG